MAGDLVISEFVASNDTGIRDQDQERPDWIEVQNVSMRDVNLEGWFLTDSQQDLDRWKFPAVTVRPNASLVVFASGKNRATAGSELHTNFRLSAGGEYLALVRPDGKTVEHDFGPDYPPQVKDISYGLPQKITAGVPIAPAPTGRLMVPSVENGGSQLGTRWTAVDYDDSSWTAGVKSIGYEQAEGYENLLGTNVGPQMIGKNRSAYLRFPFTLDRPERIYSFSLAMRYDDGYVAYINGKEVARKNAPATLAWDSGATAPHRDRDAIIPEVATIVVSQYPDLLRSGANVLAIHALNDDINSSDFLIIPELSATVFEEVQLGERRYFASPTPGNPNGMGSTTSILGVEHSPTSPSVEQPLVVRVTTATSGGPVSDVSLVYRVMYGPEVVVPMVDDGTKGDGRAGDGVFVATIPAGVAQTGQMIRYRVTAGSDAANSAKVPLFLDPTNNDQYRGTIVNDPSIKSQLPVIHLFMENPAAGDTVTGTRGSVFHNGKFYDNVEIDTTGRTVGLAGPKKSHDIQFSAENWFEFGEEKFRMNDFDIISDFWNREKIRVALGYQTMAAVGTPSHLSRNVRVHLNGGFYATYFFVDGGNEQFLERAGLDPRGALYKMNLGFGPGQGMSKKQTRTWEDTSDLREFFVGLSLTGEERVRYLHDNVNMAATVNYLAGLVIMAHGDCCGKNLYIYRDTEGTGEWEPLPWDMDSAFGRGGVNESQSYFVTAGGIFSGMDNQLIKELHEDVPGFSEMYLRRLRTLMDQFVQVPGTPSSELYFERRIDELIQQIAPEAQMDFDKWGSWITDPVTGRITYGKEPEGVPTWQQEIGLLRNAYMPQRRVFLYDSLKQVNGGVELPPQVDAPKLKFGRVDAAPASGNEDEEYIEITNPLSTAVDISGWQLAGGVQHTFAPGTVIPAGRSLFVSPNVRAFRARTTGPSGGQALFLQGAYQGHLSNAGTTVKLVAANQAEVASLVVAPAPTPIQQYLRVSEIMYMPQAQAADGRFAADDFEFIEFVNTSPTQTLDLRHVQLRDAVQFQFPAVTLGPSEVAVVVRNQDAFVHRYGTKARVLGQYGGTTDDWSLSNGGETLTVDLGVGDRIQTIAYDDIWYPTTDGGGYSLTAVNPAGPADRWSVAEGWRASDAPLGSPGVVAQALAGDFDANGQLDATDIDLFAAGLRVGDLRFDLTRDGRVDTFDRDQLVRGIFQTNYGDTNLDKRFDSTDLVLVFQAGQYEDSGVLNSGWRQGDWNCDGEFGTQDLVLAFQGGAYATQAGAMGKNAGEAADWELALAADALFADAGDRDPWQE